MLRIELLTENEQNFDGPSARPSVHGEPLIVRPDGVDDRATEPEGAVGVAPVSVTSTVQLLVFPADAGDGEHDTPVLVGLDTTRKVPPPLAAWALVGLYEAWNW